MGGLGGVGSHHHGQEYIVARHAQQSQTHDQQAGDRPPFEGNVERSIQSFGGGLRSAHIGAHRHVHADITGQSGQDRTQREADGGWPF